MNQVKFKKGDKVFNRTCDIPQAAIVTRTVSVKSQQFYQLEDGELLSHLQSSDTVDWAGWQAYRIKQIEDMEEPAYRSLIDTDEPVNAGR